MAGHHATPRESVETLGDAGNVVAILAEPDAPGAGLPAFVLLNAGVLHRVGPHRLHVRLARALAAAGHAALRIDLSGIGDSRPVAHGLSFRDSAVADTRAALDRLGERTGARSAVLFGICAGADNALAAALRDERVAGIVLVDPHAYATRRARLRRLRQRLARGGLLKRVFALRRAAPPAAGRSERQPPPRARMRSDLAALTARGVRILSIHTCAQGVRNNHPDQLFECFPELRGQVDTLYFPLANHTFTELAQQAALIEAVLAWCQRRFPGRGA